MRKHLTKLLLAGRVILLLLCVLIYTLAPTTSTSALIGDIESLQKDQGFYAPSTQCGGGNYVQADFNPGKSVNPSTHSIENAKTIMGIAKTYNLGQKGALVGLITGIQESSGLKNYANSNVPISKENPAWLKLQTPGKKPFALGNDNDSVGIMQQRVGSGWSTYGSGQDKDIVWQLMDPAYAAQAFFGSPKDAQFSSKIKNPGALRKGLINVEGWESLAPGVAAQKVQISKYPDAYAKHVGEAQDLLNKYWDEAPALALPIPIDGSDPGGGNVALVSGDNNCGSGNVPTTGLFNLLVLYADPEYHDAPWLTFYVAVPDHDAFYKQAVDTAIKHGQYVGGGAHPGVDCGGFITLLMRNSGRDPTYNKNGGNTAAQEEYLKSSGKYDQVVGTDGKRVNGEEDLQPGDIAIIGAEHTYIYTGKFTYVDPANGQTKTWKKNAASASIDSWRTPMASNAYDFERYNWYRLKEAPSPTETGVSV